MTPEERGIAAANRWFDRIGGHGSGELSDIIADAIRSAEREAYERAAKVADEWATNEQRRFGNGGPAAVIRNLAREGE